MGTAGSNIINGTPRADVIHAGAGNDVVNGRGGSDVICGGDGADDLRGQGGNDRLYGNLDGVTEEEIPMDACNMEPGLSCLFVTVRGDTLRGNAGQDLLVPGWDNRQFDAGQVDRIPDYLRWDTSPRVRVNLTQKWATGDGRDTITAAGPIRVVTSRFADTVVGTDSRDHLDTGGGADLVIARGGNDVVRTGSVAASQLDLAYGGAGDDDLFGAGGPTELRGDAGDDHLVDTSAIGSDRMYGGTDRDTVEDKVIPLSGQVYDGGGDALDEFRPVLRVGGDSEWNMVTGVMSFSVPGPTTLQAVGFHQLRVRSGSYVSVWSITGTPLADGVDFFGLSGGPVTLTFRSAGGDDRFAAAGGDDTFDGGAGQDRFDDDQGGTNTCISVEFDPSAHCDVVSAAP